LSFTFVSFFLAFVVVVVVVVDLWTVWDDDFKSGRPLVFVCLLVCWFVFYNSFSPPLLKTPNCLYYLLHTTDPTRKKDEKVTEEQA
jgi:amino acid transporter